MPIASLLTTATLALFATTLFAQTGPAPLGSGNAAYVGAFNHEFDIEANLKSTRAAWVVISWRLQSGQIEYSIDAGTVEFSGDQEPVASLSAAELFDIVARESIVAGFDNGYSDCPLTGSAATGLTVASCGQMSSSGFSPSGTNLSRRAYSVECTPQTPVANLVGVTGTFECSSADEPTASEVDLE